MPAFAGGYRRFRVAALDYFRFAFDYAFGNAESERERVFVLRRDFRARRILGALEVAAGAGKRERVPEDLCRFVVLHGDGGNRVVARRHGVVLHLLAARLDGRKLAGGRLDGNFA